MSYADEVMSWSDHQHNRSFDSSNGSQQYSTLTLDTRFAISGWQTPSPSVTDSRRPSCTLSATPDSLSFSGCSGYGHSQPPTPANSVHAPDMSFNGSFSAYSPHGLPEPPTYCDGNAGRLPSPSFQHPGQRTNITTGMSSVDGAHWYDCETQCVNNFSVPMYTPPLDSTFILPELALPPSNILPSQDLSPVSSTGINAFSCSQPPAYARYCSYTGAPAAAFSTCNPSSLVDDLYQYPPSASPIKIEGSPSKASTKASKVSKSRSKSSNAEKKSHFDARSIKVVLPAAPYEEIEVTVDDKYPPSLPRDKMCGFVRDDGTVCKDMHTTQHKLNRHKSQHLPRELWCPVPGCEMRHWDEGGKGLSRLDNACQHFMTHLEPKKTQRTNILIDWRMLQEWINEMHLDDEKKLRMINNTQSQLLKKNGGSRPTKRNPYGEESKQRGKGRKAKKGSVADW